MKQRRFPAVFLLVTLVTVPFVVVATLLYQYRLGLHDRHHVMQEDLAVFAAGLRASQPLEQSRDLVPATAVSGDPDLAARYREARDQAGAALAAYRRAMEAQGTPDLANIVAGVENAWNNTEPRAAVGRAGAVPRSGSDRRPAACLHGGGALPVAVVGHPPGPPGPGLALPLNGLREVRRNLGMMRALLLYGGITGNSLDPLSLYLFGTARDQLAEAMADVDQQLGNPEDEEMAMLRRRWQRVRESLEAYRLWSGEALDLSGQLEMSWREALARADVPWTGCTLWPWPPWTWLAPWWDAATIG